jgi:hypothetical protein
MYVEVKAPTKNAKTTFFPKNSWRLVGFQVCVTKSKIWSLISNFDFVNHKIKSILMKKEIRVL